MKGHEVELLLVSGRWPHGPTPEFLDAEIRVLARSFKEIRVAPLRPTGQVVGHVPDGVEVDYSLSRWLASDAQSAAGRYARGLRSIARCGDGVGVGTSNRRELWTGLRSFEWARTALMSRADLISVMLWARRSSRPALAYTFWLGPATVGLRRAWPMTPIVSRAHGGDVYCEQHGWSSIPFQADAVGSVDLLAAVSQDGRDYLTKKYARSAACIELHRLGFDDIGGLAGRADGGTVRILSVSSIDENKRVDRIAQCALYLARSGVPVHWTHLGDGPARNKIAGIVEVRPSRLTVDLRGLVAHDEVRREMLHGNYSVFVNLSLSEGAPVSLMEAQCVGLPVVATRVGGSAEVAPAQWNYLVDVDASPAAVAGAILAASESPWSAAEARRLHWIQNSDANQVYPVFAERLMQLALSGRSCSGA